MSPEDAPPEAGSDAPATRRRTVLRRLGAGSLLALGGVGAAAAQPERPHEERGSPPQHADPPVDAPAGRREPDVDDLPAVDEAAVVVDDDGSVSTRLRVDAEELASESEASASPEARTVAQYSLGLEVDAPGRQRGRALAEGRPDDAGLRAVLRKRERHREASVATTAPDVDGSIGTDGSISVDSNATDGDAIDGGTSDSDVGDGGDEPTFGVQTHEDGIDEVPDAGDRDVLAFGQTASQECGPLARTNVLADAYESVYGTYFYGADADRESADGDACAGHEWNATFEAFCDYLGWLPGYDCAVPSAFDTTWRVEAADRTGTRATTVFSCANFPAIPDTVVAAHEVALVDGGSGPTVEFGSRVGVVPEFDASDYELDANGVSNLIVDGLAIAFPGVRTVYSHALATYLLKHDAGVIV